MNILTILALALAHNVVMLCVLWVLYLAVMNLRRANDVERLSGAARFFGLAVEYIGLVIDAYVNIVVMTPCMLELPRELLVTGRLTRHINAQDGWRKDLATWMCSTLLDRFDSSGCHCKRLNNK